MSLAGLVKGADVFVFAGVFVATKNGGNLGNIKKYTSVLKNLPNMTCFLNYFKCIRLLNWPTLGQLIANTWAVLDHSL